MEYITSNKGGKKLAFGNNIYIEQKVLSNGAVWGDFVQGDFVRGDFVRGDFVLGGILSGGDFVLEPFQNNHHLLFDNEKQLSHERQRGKIQEAMF